jgi:hypothetical protein
MIGLFPSPADSRILLKHFPGSAVAHSPMLPTIIAISELVYSFGSPIVWAATVVWLVPVLAWTTPSGTESPRWVRGALPNVHHPASLEGGLPSLRRILVAAVFGGVSSWVVDAAVTVCIHPWSAPVDGSSMLIYTAWLVVAFTASVVVTALVRFLTSTRH